MTQNQFIAIIVALISIAASGIVACSYLESIGKRLTAIEKKIGEKGKP